MTRDGGENWKKVTPSGLPPGGRVDAVETSPHNPAKAYACILRYQFGDWKPYIYKTLNYGDSWQLLTNGSNGIPDNYPVRVVREDPIKEGLLFAGTEYGLFVSFDDGQNWKPFQQNLPLTPITDIKIIRGDIVMSTMGRGFWMLDNITSLQQSDFTDGNELLLFSPNTTIRYKYPSGARSSRMPQYPRPAAIIDYILPDSITGNLKMEIIDQENNVIATMFSDTSKTKIADQIIEDMSTNRVEYIVDNSLNTKPGLNRYKWDMTMKGPWHKEKNRRFKDGPAAKPGIYTISLTLGDESSSQKFELKMDPRSADHVSSIDIDQQITLQLKISDLLSSARKLQDKLETEKKEFKKEENKSAKQKDRLDKINSILSRLKTKEGIYEQPMLVPQISYLYSMLNDTDQAPGKDALEQYEALKKKFEGIENGHQQ